jgi:serine/threonine-protein kinase
MAIPTEPVRRKSSGGLLFGAGALVLLLVGGALFIALRPKPVEVKPPEVAQTPPPVKVPEVVKAPEGKPEPPEPAAAPQKPEVKPEVKPELAAIKANAKSDHGGDVPAKAAALPPEVAAELTDAEKALAGGDTREAIRLARHSLLVKKSGRAFSIITLANCKQGDLGGAKAAMHSVESRDAARVKHECKAAGIDL